MRRTQPFNFKVVLYYAVCDNFYDAYHEIYWNPTQYLIITLLVCIDTPIKPCSHTTPNANWCYGGLGSELLQNFAAGVLTIDPPLKIRSRQISRHNAHVLFSDCAQGLEQYLSQMEP